MHYRIARLTVLTVAALALLTGTIQAAPINGWSTLPEPGRFRISAFLDLAGEKDFDSESNAYYDFSLEFNNYLVQGDWGLMEDMALFAQFGLIDAEFEFPGGGIEADDPGLLLGVGAKGRFGLAREEFAIGYLGQLAYFQTEYSDDYREVVGDYRYEEGESADLSSFEMQGGASFIWEGIENLSTYAGVLLSFVFADADVRYYEREYLNGSLQVRVHGL